MDRDTILYTYLTWHISIFVSFSWVPYAENVNFETFEAIKHITDECFMFAF